ncbi:MAG TPA: glycosyltransferase family 2 protein [Micromonosporaceae bacterium]|nr:glycosyltransferase family 2 protein [Micromonosporaceae bacterium]
MPEQRPPMPPDDDLRAAVAGGSPTAPPVADLTIVIPTRNESQNVRHLVERLNCALRGSEAEIVFVDDSDDGTPETIAAIAANSPCRLRVLHRPAGSRSGGLGGAVLTGIRCAQGEWVVVMDGDLQHPPEAVPAVIQATVDDAVDAVVASRYRSQGAATGLDGPLRSLVSSASTLVTRLVFPWRLRRVTDPMSGFFAVRRTVLDGVDLHPRGYKILLEILVRAKVERIAEVPYTFEPRSAGESKASLREGLRFLHHLAELRLGTLVRPRSGPARLAGFAAAGASGIVINSLALWLLGGLLWVPYLVAAFLAVQVAIVWNFTIVDRLVMPGPKQGGLRRFGRFWLLNNSSVPVHLALLYGLVQQMRMHYLMANLVAVAAVFIVRYLLTSRWVYGVGWRGPGLPPVVRRAVTGLRRAPQARVVLAVLLALAAVPTTAAMAWNGLWTRQAAVPLLIPLSAAAALLVGRLRPSTMEPNVHDRQVDLLIAAVLLVSAGAMTTMEPDLRQVSSGWLLLATVAYLAAAAVLLLGTRTAARLRWVLILPLVSADGVLPSGVSEAAGRLVRAGVGLLSQPSDAGLHAASLALWHRGQLLILPEAAVPGGAVTGALACLFLAALACFGLNIRLLVRFASAAAVLVGAAILCGVAAVLVGRLFGTESLRVALLPAFFDVVLAATVAMVAWRWSREVIIPRAQPRHYLPRGRLALVALALAAVPLGLRALPGLSMVRPHIPFVAEFNSDGTIHLVPAWERP